MQTQLQRRAAGPSTGRRLAVPKAILGGLLSKLSPAAGPSSREAKKEALLDAIKPLQRGVREHDKEEIDRLARALEAANPNKKALASPLVNGKWELLYTTSASILGTNKPAILRPSGPIYQIIDAVDLKARNVESAPFFNQVSAELEPLSANKVAVQFKEFKLLGLIPITAPPSARGELAVTYLDEELRVSRGDKGNLFVLRMVARDAKP